ncbi:hypothetical protein IF1G_01949 [Cordyceps javanica]|uniref:Uncharacterized protein n=1 Tax=Cordyceps javanica TaxID=43265 RepID=A0A545VDE3_9HYPO|nr:hypothetical protein IF1G_01949 [Cordyceps javanica]
MEPQRHTKPSGPQAGFGTTASDWRTLMCPDTLIRTSLFDRQSLQHQSLCPK